MEGHSVDFFIHILKYEFFLNILVIGYKEFHSPFQTSTAIKIFMHPFKLALRLKYSCPSTIEISLKSCHIRNQ